MASTLRSSLPPESFPLEVGAIRSVACRSQPPGCKGKEAEVVYLRETMDDGGVPTGGKTITYQCRTCGNRFTLAS